jgi:transposase-like protein
LIGLTQTEDRRRLASRGVWPPRSTLLQNATVSAQEMPKAARVQWDAVAEQLRAKFPNLAVLLVDAKREVLAFMDFPKADRFDQPT